MTVRIILFVCVLFLSRGILAAEQTGPVQQPGVNGADQPKLESLPDAIQSMLQLALNQIGVSYHRGGVSPETGFDCSGFVRYIFDQAAGIELPHSARAISLIGTSIQLAELHPGDLLFFHLKRRTVSHVGIYLGNNQFIHDASNRTGGVRISNLEGYWAGHFKMARRFDLPSEQSSKIPE